jgi:hypothetical protein
MDDRRDEFRTDANRGKKIRLTNDGDAVSEFKRSLVSVAIAGLLVAGCGDETTSRTRLTIDRAPQKIQMAMFDAAESKIAKCMRRKGFSYVQRTLVSLALPIPPIGEPPRGNDGYGASAMVVTNQTKRTPGPNDRNFLALSAEGRIAYDQALTGPAGCSAVGMAASQKVMFKVDHRISAIRNEFNGDPLVRDYRDSWRRCMAQHGYTDRTRSDLVVRLLNSFGTKPELLAKEEKRVAQTDLRCISAEQEKRFQNLANNYFLEAGLNEVLGS